MICRVVGMLGFEGSFFTLFEDSRVPTLHQLAWLNINIFYLGGRERDRGGIARAFLLDLYFSSWNCRFVLLLPQFFRVLCGGPYKYSTARHECISFFNNSNFYLKFF